MYHEIQEILGQYDTISLAETESVKLMNRTDSKYVIRIEQACDIVRLLAGDYRVLGIDGQRAGAYSSVYFDTTDLQMFYAHVTGRFPRFKVRKRNYSQNNLDFFEIKRKGYNGRTIKKRLLLNDETGSRQSGDLLSAQTPFCMDDLKATLINYFDRVTLVNNAKTERLTLDFNLHFNLPQGIQTPVYSETVIVEIKQDKRAESRASAMLRQENIRPTGMSKYCTGMLLLNTWLHCKQYKPNFYKFLNTKYERFY